MHYVVRADIIRKQFILTQRRRRNQTADSGEDRLLGEGAGSDLDTLKPLVDFASQLEQIKDDGTGRRDLTVLPHFCIRP
jgi:hypothetical protein